MDWLPPAPSDFRAALGNVLGATDARDRYARLITLARCRLSFLETIQLDRALGRLAEGIAPESNHVRLAIVASATVDHLIPAIRVAALRRELLVTLYRAPFGQYRQEVLEPNSPLYQFQPEFVLFSLTASDAVPRIPIAATVSDREEQLHAALGHLSHLWRRMRDTLGAAVIQQTLLDTTEPLFGNLERAIPGSPTQVLRRFNELLVEATTTERVLILDIARTSERDGLDAWFDRGRWLQARMEIAPKAAPMYGEQLARVIGAVRGCSRKCLVLDLDQTLWGGVIGDDGIAGITLGEGTAAGEAHLALQHYVKQLRARGVILAVCSKNDLSVAEVALRDHPGMVLQRSDFAAFLVNWDDKSSNLCRIAQSLNLGLDSLVFVDDNPVERSRVRQSLPMVAVPELPDDPAQYVDCLASAGYFESIAFTADDRSRAAQYATNAQRDDARSSSESLDDFLRGLNMSMTMGSVTDVDLTRVAQLVNKTNQFNPTTRRRTADEIARLGSDPGNVILRVRLRDRFGDNGLVSAVILRPDASEPGVLEVDTWVMSCRVFGRQLECAVLNGIVTLLRKRGAVALRAEFIPTAKNSVVSGLYGDLGFARRSNGPTAQGSTTWELTLANYDARPTHIAMEDDANERG